MLLTGLTIQSKAQVVSPGDSSHIPQDSILKGFKKKFAEISPVPLRKPTIEEFLPKEWKPTIHQDAIRKLKLPSSGLQDAVQMLKAKPLALGRTSLLTDGYYWPTDTSIIPSSFGRVVLSQSISTFSIPVDASVWYNKSFYTSPAAMANYAFDYDEPGFVSQLSKQLGKIDPSKLLTEDMQSLLNQKVEGLIQDQLTGWRQQFGDQWETVMQRIGNPMTLLNADPAALRAMILPDSIMQQAGRLQESFEWLSAKGQSMSSDEKVQLAQITKQLQEQKSLKNLYEQVSLQKGKWLKEGWTQALRDAEILQKLKVNQLLQSPETVKKLAKEKLQLSSLQRLFLNVSRLNIGQTSLDKSAIFKQFLSRGLFSEFLNDKGKYLSLLYGKHESLGSIFDQAFTGSAFPAAGTALGFALGKGAPQGPHTHFSLHHFQMRQTPNSWQNMSSSILQKATVIGISKRMDVGAKGSVEADFSTSLSDLSFIRSPLDSAGGGGMALKSMLQGGNFFQQVAFSVDYSNRFEKWQLDHRAFVRYAGSKYTNPGNPFLPSGTTELGLQVRKTAYKGKFSAGLRAVGRQYQFAEQAVSKYQQFNAAADLRWRLKRGQFISVRYQPSLYWRNMAGQSQLVSNVSRLAVEGQLVRKFAGLQYRNYVSLSAQQNMFTTATGSSLQEQRYNAIILNMNQQLVLKQNTIFMNILWNTTENSTALVYFNDAVNADGGFTYVLSKQIYASSSVTYNQVKGWYQQAGFRQSLSGSMKQLQWHLNLDIRKNIKVENPLYLENFRIDWGVRYIINRN